jgi:hypothetical protein
MTAADDLAERKDRTEVGGVDDDVAFVQPSIGQKVAIWLVGSYLVLNAGAGLVSLFLLAGRAVPLAADKVALINSMPPLLFFAGFVHIFLTLAGGVFLLMRKRIALPFLAGGAIAKVGSEAFTSPPANLTISPVFYAAAMVAEMVVFVAILAFVASLWRRRVLEP